MKKHYYGVLAIFIVVLSMRLFISLQTPYFSDDESYYVLRQVDNLRSTGRVFFYDELSYGGRNTIMLPGYYAILTFFNFLMPQYYGLKIIVNLFASSLVIVIFYLSKQITKNNKVSLLAALSAGFMPIYFQKTVNSLSPLCFTIPVAFFLLYLMLKMQKDEKKIPLYFITLLTIFIFTSAEALLFVAALVVYIFMLRLENMKETKIQFEILIFSLFLSLWLYLILFKDILLKYQLNIFKSNIPAQIITRYFIDLNPLEMIYLVGIIPVLSGLYIIYRYLFKEKSPSMYLMLSFAITVGSLLFLKILAFEIGMIYLGVILIVLFAHSLKDLFNYIKKTKFRYISFVSLIFLVLILLTQMIPSFYYGQEKIKDIPSEDQILALEWIKETSAEDATVLGTVGEGHLITYFSKRKNVMDSNFMLVTDTTTQYGQIQTIFQTKFYIAASRLLSQHDINYIFLSEKGKEEFGISDLEYGSEICFRKNEFGSVLVYEYICNFEE